jgi:hypothetical protein
MSQAHVVGWMGIAAAVFILWAGTRPTKYVVAGCGLMLAAVGFM